jgi:prevent-host-death family protein
MARHEPVWPPREAKARLSEVVRRAVEEGPQHVTVRGKAAAVILFERDFRQLTSRRPQSGGRSLRRKLDGRRMNIGRVKNWTENLLIALARAGVISEAHSVELHGAYLRQLGYR